MNIIFMLLSAYYVMNSNGEPSRLKPMRIVLWMNNSICNPTVVSTHNRGCHHTELLTTHWLPITVRVNIFLAYNRRTYYCPATSHANTKYQPRIMLRNNNSLQCDNYGLMSIHHLLLTILRCLSADGYAHLTLCYHNYSDIHIYWTIHSPSFLYLSTYCGLATPYGNIHLSQHWSR